MSKLLGIRDITRNFSILYDYDYVEIEDKKTHQIKGIFVSEKYLDDVKALIESKKAEEIQRKKDELRRLTGKGRVSKRFDGLSSSEIRQRIAREKEGA